MNCKVGVFDGVFIFFDKVSCGHKFCVDASTCVLVFLFENFQGVLVAITEKVCFIGVATQLFFEEVFEIFFETSLCHVDHTFGRTRFFY